MQSPGLSGPFRPSRTLTPRRIALGIGMVLSLGLGACATAPPLRDRSAENQIKAELDQAAAARVAPARQRAVDAALLPPLATHMPRPSRLPEQRFNLAVNNAPAEEIFLSIVSGTRYSMLVHPAVTGQRSSDARPTANR